MESKFYGRCDLFFQSGCKVTFGKNFILSSQGGIDNFMRSKIYVLNGAKLIVGEYTGMTNVAIHCHQEITIGHHVNIGAGTMLFDTDFHSTKWQDRLNRATDVKNKVCRPIHIGNLCFIGTRCIIGKGVTIGDKTIIAAGSVVTKSIPANCIAGGNPCRVIRELKNEG